MQLNKLSILNFKNITQVELDFNAKINCLIGANGVGKTNLLDAIYYLSFCRSYFHMSDAYVVKHGEEQLMVRGLYERNKADEVISCGIKLRQKKQFKRNNKAYTKLSEHIGLIPLVMVSPTDVRLVIDGSEERRKYMDGVISQYNPIYLSNVIRYNKLLAQRNALLKQNIQSLDLLAVIDEQLADIAMPIFTERKDFIEKLIPVFGEYYSFISGSNEQVVIKYASHLAGEPLVDQLKASFEKDRVLGYTSKGIHKDDIHFLLDEFPIKREGSQGQRKTFLVALKLAQYEFIRRLNGFSPLLLLDDVFDKLDKFRVEKIVELVSDERFGQIFITDTNRDHLDTILRAMNSSYTLFNVENGNINTLENVAI